eukprot:TRINITY_DN101794_c0_g1_i1.p1 TRINITY_DN101794_c0_g1~~TRINITY_DN101794_c0_g1_i1.p1  ORF type:complete len:124 (+),score=6.34 TRINITY_DN101794_c0_g1_i1:95-466(+)
MRNSDETLPKLLMRFTSVPIPGDYGVAKVLVTVYSHDVTTMLGKPNLSASIIAVIVLVADLLRLVFIQVRVQRVTKHVNMWILRRLPASGESTSAPHLWLLVREIPASDLKVQLSFNFLNRTM